MADEFAFNSNESMNLIILHNFKLTISLLHKKLCSKRQFFAVMLNLIQLICLCHINLFTIVIIDYLSFGLC